MTLSPGGSNPGRSPIQSSLLALLLLAGCQRAPESPPRVSTDLHPALRVQPGTGEAPVVLSADDGTGLQLTSYHASAVLQGPLAFTEIKLTFHNPEHRALEGRFQITLPSNGALSRFAMRQEKGWQEGEVVETRRAQQVYEDFLHQRQDPALLERQAGNQFSARVFPIPADGNKELILSYSETLEEEHPYRLPLAGLPQVRSFGFEASVWKSPQDEPIKLSQTQRPDGDLAIDGARWSHPLQRGRLALIPVRPAGSQTPDPVDSLVLLVDTSASRALDFDAELKSLERLLAELAPSVQVKIAAFDQSVLPLYEGPASGAQVALDKLRQRGALGATDLAAALKWARGQKAFRRVVLLSDGVASAGGDPEGIGRRLDTLALGGVRDARALKRLAQPSGGRALDETPPRWLGVLEKRPLAKVKVEVPGAEWVWPSELEGAVPGEEVLVYAQLGGKGAVRPRVGGTDVPFTPIPVQWPLLERAAWAADLERLEAAGGKDKEVIEISTAQRIASDLTSWLVLESEGDYERYGISRKRLAPVLTVGDHGVVALERDDVVLAASPEFTPAAAQTELLALTSSATPTASSPPGDDEVTVDRSYVQSVSRGDGPAGLSLSGGHPENTSAGGLGAGTVPIQPYSDSASSAAHTRADFNRSSSSMHRRMAEAPAPVERRQAVGGAAQSIRSRHDEANYPRYTAERGLTDEAAPAARRAVAAPSSALEGELLKVQELIEKGHPAEALATARAWRKRQPGEVLPLVALGRALQSSGDSAEALRAYGSIADLFPGRADLRRFAGNLLESVGPAGWPLALDSYQKALKQRPDHPSSARLTAYALARLGRWKEAHGVMTAALARSYPEGRFRAVRRILEEDLHLIEAGWVSQDASQAAHFPRRDRQPSLRFILTWETDANDVDFHIQDAHGGHAFYSDPELGSGGRLYGDVTTGYGPECFCIPGNATAAPYRIWAHYYSRGPMGYGMGKVEVMRHDGAGHFKWDERPYVIMRDQADFSLGSVDAE